MIDSQIREMTEQRRERLRRLAFFDANLWIGRPQGFPLAEEFDLAALRSAMTDRLIIGGLVSHWSGKTSSPQQGNAALLEAGLGETNCSLGVIMTGLPLFPPEGGPLPGYGEPPASLAGVRLFPRTHGFALTEWCVGSLWRWMIERHLPLFLWHTEFEWEPLYRLAKAFGDLPIIVESQPRKIIYQLRPLMAVLRDCPNVYVEISNLTGPAFEMIVKHVGPQRLIFGSFLPANDPFVPTGMILDAELSDDDRALIAGGNLRRLIGRGRP